MYLAIAGTFAGPKKVVVVVTRIVVVAPKKVVVVVTRIVRRAVAVPAIASIIIFEGSGVCCEWACIFVNAGFLTVVERQRVSLSGRCWK